MTNQRSIRFFLLLLMLIAVLPAGSTRAQADSSDHDQVIGEWKSTIHQLGKLRLRHQLADSDEQKEIRQEFETLMAKAHELEPAVNVAIEAQYQQSPRKNPELEALLLTRLKATLNTVGFREVLRLAKMLIEAGCKNPAPYTLGVPAAIDHDQLDLAKAWIEKAEQQNIGGANAEALQKALRKPLALWNDEQEYRQKLQAAGEADPAKLLPRVKIETSKGDVVVELFEDDAPNTVANFISLVEKGYYDGHKMHRIIPGFMAQMGDPLGNGKGGPGYKIACECHQPNYRRHFRGTLSMAHSGRDTGGSQFFLTFNSTPHLNGKHTAFGRVVEGFDVLDELEKVGTPDGKPIEIPVIIEASVLNKRDHKYLPKKVKP
jgi:cyclophilin family peptidyl-prolyl cis-trans isomerase